MGPVTGPYWTSAQKSRVVSVALRKWKWLERQRKISAGPATATGSAQALVVVELQFSYPVVSPKAREVSALFIHNPIF